MDDMNFFILRKEGMTYISKVFKFNERSTEAVRQVRMVLEGSDSLVMGEIEGAMCLRLSGEKRKTQVTALITQDNKRVQRLSLQTYQTRADGSYQGYEKKEFTFRRDEFARLLEFLKQIDFIDTSNEGNFQIEDLSKNAGAKTITDASDSDIVERIGRMEGQQKDAVFQALRGSLTADDVNVLLGRRQGLQEFEDRIKSGDWAEAKWQDFFEREQWVFGYPSVRTRCTNVGSGSSSKIRAFFVSASRAQTASGSSPWDTSSYIS